MKINKVKYMISALINPKYVFIVFKQLVRLVLFNLTNRCICLYLLPTLRYLPQTPTQPFSSILAIHVGLPQTINTQELVTFFRVIFYFHMSFLFSFLNSSSRYLLFDLSWWLYDFDSLSLFVFRY